MSDAAFSRLEDVVLDDSFPDVDLALRRGRHVDREDGPWYAFLADAGEHLELFYRRFGCELVHKSEGYYYLVPHGDRLAKRQLSSAEMLVGQALTLLYLDPATIAQGGVVTRAQVLSQLAGTLGSDALIRALNPKRRKHDERVAEENVRTRVSEALRRLAALAFIELLEDDGLRLRPALMRFAEPVRSASAPGEALERLLAAGELVLAEEADASSIPEGLIPDDELPATGFPGASEPSEARRPDDVDELDIFAFDAAHEGEI